MSARDERSTTAYDCGNLSDGKVIKLEHWWTWPGSNRRPLPCHGSALPAAPQSHFVERRRRTDGAFSILSHAERFVKREPAPEHSRRHPFRISPMHVLTDTLGFHLVSLPGTFVDDWS